MKSDGPISLSIGVSEQIAQGAAQCAPGADHFPREQFYRRLDYAETLELPTGGWVAVDG